MKELQTYHLYHHQPDPLPLEEVADRAWLINNAVAYSMAAVIQAPDVAEALQAAQCKATSRPLPRRAAVQASNLFRETLPGDVLVAEKAAWMVDETNQARPLAYPLNQPWKHLRQHSYHQAAVATLAWSPDGKIIAAVAAADHRVVLHVVTSDEGYRNAYHRGEGHSVMALAWSPRGTRLAAARYDGDIHLWKPAPWEHGGVSGSILICRTEERGRSYVTAHCVAWSPDEERIFAGYADGMLAAWDARTGAVLLSQREYHSKAITTLAFAPYHEHLLLSASADTSVRVWDCATDRETIYQHAAAVVAAVWSPDGKLVASCERGDATIYLWNPQTGALLERIPLSVSSTRLPEVCSLAWSPDGRVLAAGCDENTIQLIDLAQRQHVHTYRVDVHSRRCVEALAWSPDGSLLAAGDGSTGIDLWQTQRDLEAASNPLPPNPDATNLSTISHEAERAEEEKSPC
jgi:dipeptidyl aminopeptidase/acylaminoacyl peptidase